MAYSKEKLDKIFAKGVIIKGMNSMTHRKDKCGYIIYRYSYGKKSKMGWEVDHSKPKSKGGTDHINNLQPLHWYANKCKTDKHPFSKKNCK